MTTDPQAILGVTARASDDEIRAAYLRLVKDHPPEKEPEEFERIRDAYNTLRDPRRRMRDMLFSGDPFAPFSELVSDADRQRRYVGPAMWLEVLKGK